MFRRARWRLTLLYIALFAIALGVFALVFYAGFATVLVPDFDIAPELSNAQAADAAYQATIERIGAALAIAWVVAVALVSVAAWVLAARTLRPIREAHLRQRRFVADASHEIRTPLAAIRATAEGATSHDASADELRTALDRIAGSAEGLSRLTNDLLLLARADERPVDRRTDRFDLSVATTEALETMTGADRDGAGPRVVLEPDLVVSGDPDEIRRVVINLVDNAIRYSGRPDLVQVTTSGSEREAVVAVGDSGPGIAAADLDQIFEPFHRVRADAASPDGSGLGLAIARSLAERNGGRLTVASRPGAGSTFRLVLPRSR
jgi:two-component Ni(II)/redox sensor kinase NrsS